MTTPAPAVAECSGSNKGKEITPPDGIIPLDSPPTSGSDRTPGKKEEKKSNLEEKGEWISVQRKRTKTDGKVRQIV